MGKIKKRKKKKEKKVDNIGYYIYKLKFVTPIHIGNGKLSSTDIVINADTIFSALCIQQNKISGGDGVEKIINYTKKGELLISDAMPYINENLYIRKPLQDNFTQRDATKGNGKSNEKTNILDVQKKNKKIQFIKINDAKKYIKCTTEYMKKIEKEEVEERLGSVNIRTMSSSRDEKKLETGDMLPFRVVTFNFKKDAGLYIIAGFKNDNKNIKKEFERLLRSLGHIGIGGKKSSGFGKFELNNEIKKNNDIALTREEKNGYNNFISLSLCMAKKCEIDEIDIKNSAYKVIKRGGFIDSATYSKNYVKKNNFYAFESGSVFKKTFDGDVFIVKNNGEHSVYKYAKPIFLGVKV